MNLTLTAVCGELRPDDSKHGIDWRGFKWDNSAVINSAVTPEFRSPAAPQHLVPFLPCLDPVCRSVYKVGQATTVSTTAVDMN